MNMTKETVKTIGYLQGLVDGLAITVTYIVAHTLRGDLPEAMQADIGDAVWEATEDMCDEIGAGLWPSGGADIEGWFKDLAGTIHGVVTEWAGEEAADTVRDRIETVALGARKHIERRTEARQPEAEEPG